MNLNDASCSTSPLSHSKHRLDDGKATIARIGTGHSAMVVLLFLSFATMTAGRWTIHVTIVQMADEFNWDKATVGVILSSFYWGYTITQIIGGWLSDKYGGLTIHWTFGIGWTSALLGIATFGGVSVSLMIALNFIFGACQGVFFPSVISVISVKVPKESRSFFYSKMATGGQVGFVLIGFVGSMFLYENGWRHVYYLMGFTSGLSVLSIYVLSSRTTTSNITPVNDVPPASGIREECTVPWRGLLKETPVLALFVCHFAQGFFDKSMNWTPTYFHDNFPQMKEQAWVYNIIPRLTYTVTAFSGGWIYEKLTTNGCTVTRGRKIMEFVSLFVGGSFLLLIALSNWYWKDYLLSLVLMSLGYMARGCEVAGSTLNPTDLALSYAGLLYGMMNTSAAIAAIVGLYFAGHILQVTGNWSLVYLMVGSVCYCGIAVFVKYGSGERLSLDSRNS